MVAITAQTMADEIRRQQKLSRSIAADQAAVSSGTKLLTPSQDPQSWVQVSELARAQSQQAAWKSNISYGQSRASKAESNLTELNNLFTRARELLVTASTSAIDGPGRAAVLADLQGIRASMNELVNEKDYQGLPVFDETQTIAVPVSRGINLDVVGTKQSISEGVNVNGTSMSLDDIMAAAITAVDTGSEAERSGALAGLESALNHIIVAQSVQGIRSEKLDIAAERLTDIDLSLKERRSGLEDTDLTETLTALQGKLTTLEAAQAAFARINRQSLFDLIG